MMMDMFQRMTPEQPHMTAPTHQEAADPNRMTVAAEIQQAPSEISDKESTIMHQLHRLRPRAESHVQVSQTQAAPPVIIQNTARSKRIDTPKLGRPDDITVGDFQTWRAQFHGDAQVERLHMECMLMVRRAILMTILMQLWTKFLRNYIHRDTFC